METTELWTAPKMKIQLGNVVCCLTNWSMGVGRPRKGSWSCRVHFLSSEPRSEDWTGFAALTKFRAANTLSTACQAPDPNNPKQPWCWSQLSARSSSISFHTGHGTMPFPFWPNPLIWPKGKLRYSGPVRAFTTEISGELGGQEWGDRKGPGS